MYFDNAATSFPKPESVCAAVDDWMRHGAAAAGRGSHQGTDAARRLVDECRGRLARLLGVRSPSEVIFTLNCTDSLNTVLQGFLRPADRVIASTIDHNSVLRPLKALESLRGVTTDFLDFDPRTGLLDAEQLRQLLKHSPVRLVILNHGSNVTGVVQPVDELVRIVRQAGAAVLIDAAQTAGHEDVNMQRWDADFVVAAGHKGLLGPLGTGVLCIRESKACDVLPFRYGGTGTASESLDQPDALPSRFESGNLNLPGIAGLSAGVTWILDQGVVALSRQLNRRMQVLTDGLRAIRGLQLCTPAASPPCGLVSFNIDGHDCHDVAMILDQSFGIRSRAGLHCAPLAHRTLGTFDSGGAVRLSPGVLTSDEEIAAAIAAVEQIAGSRSLDA